MHALRVLGAALVVSSATAAHAYDFEIRATTVGQGYQRRWLRFGRSDRLLNVRRITQSLRLDIWNILEPPVDPGYPDKQPRAPFDLYFTTSLRLDHDFGEYTRGEVAFPLGPGVAVLAATEAVPELEHQAYGLDLLYAYVGARDVGGRVDLRLGRQLSVDLLEWYSFDGLWARVRTPWHVAFEAHGGLRVRGEPDGFLGSAAHEPDGTAEAGCVEWDPDLGVWVGAEDCRQRDRLMPTVGLAAETWGFRRVLARVAYRRSFSPTADGVLPGGDAVPGWGTSEEKAVASVRGVLLDGGVQPWAAARYDFLLATVDEVVAGVRLATREHSLTPEVAHSHPSFDGDSIFNVFSVDAFSEARMTYDFWPGRGVLRAYARGWLRRFENGDTGESPTGQEVDGSALAGGAGVGARLRRLGRGAARLDLFYEGGYGGLRAGGDAAATWRLGEALDLEGRVTAIAFESDLRGELDAVTVGAQAGGVWRMTDGVALHVLVEENVNRYEPSQFRLYAVLDLDFRPEL